MNKIQSFIKIRLQRIKGRVKTVHERFKQPVKDDFIPPNIPYQIVSQWLVDIVVYGFMITFIWNSWFGWQGWNNISLLFANGFTFWMLGEVIKHIKQALKEQ